MKTTHRSSLSKSPFPSPVKRLSLLSSLSTDSARAPPPGGSLPGLPAPSGRVRVPRRQGQDRTWHITGLEKDGRLAGRGLRPIGLHNVPSLTVKPRGGRAGLSTCVSPSLGATSAPTQTLPSAAVSPNLEQASCGGSCVGATAEVEAAASRPSCGGGSSLPPIMSTRLCPVSRQTALPRDVCQPPESPQTQAGCGAWPGALVSPPRTELPDQLPSLWQYQRGQVLEEDKAEALRGLTACSPPGRETWPRVAPCGPQTWSQGLCTAPAPDASAVA